MSVTTPAGTTNSTVRFYVPPAISVFNPTHGLPGTNVTITGVNFLDASSVKFNGSNAVFGVVNNTTITSSVPNSALTGPITVIAPAGSNTTAQNFVLDYTANLGITVSDTPDPVMVTSNLTYIIQVANSSGFSAPGVMLTNLLPANVNLKSATTTAGSLNTNGNPIIGSLGQLNVGGNITVTLVVAPQTSGTISNFAAVGSLYSDPAPANNIASNTTLVLPLPLLSIQKPAAGYVRVSWPSALTNYVLQFVPAFSNTIYWSNDLTLPTISGNEKFIVEPASNTMRYYRLKN